MRRAWSAPDDALLVARYADAETAALARELGRSVGATYVRARQLGLLKSADHIQRMADRLRDLPGHASWTDEEDAVLRDRYPDTLSKDLAQLLGRTLVAVCARAKRLGLRKSEAFHASELSGRMKPGESRSPQTQFKKGHVSLNVTRDLAHIEPWQYKPGHKPKTWVPIGTEVWREGYLWRKVRDDQRGGRARFNWRQVHLLVWEEAHGPVPLGHCVAFKNGDPRDVRLENLECVTKAEVWRRNSIHTLPEELREVIRLKARVTRRINTRSKKEAPHAEQD